MSMLRRHLTFRPVLSSYLKAGTLQTGFRVCPLTESISERRGNAFQETLVSLQSQAVTLSLTSSTCFGIMFATVYLEDKESTQVSTLSSVKSIIRAGYGQQISCPARL
ncbi:hypothetical protein TNCV_347431 [Trichonephila clavipes]|nr:hypothetical protein TNCV_347431 [Trichonephila clavipes]